MANNLVKKILPSPSSETTKLVSTFTTLVTKIKEDITANS